MSYCRWSTDLGRCDIYAYAAGAGSYIVLVATHKWHVPEDWRAPFEDVLAGDISADEEAARADATYREIAKRPLVGIDAPSAGKSFNVATLGDLKELLLSLRDEGLRFPDSVLAEIDDEMHANERDEAE